MTRNLSVILRMVLVVTSLLAMPARRASALVNVLYAAPGGLTSGSCGTWASACELWFALGLASAGEQVWARAGTYLPTISADRDISFACPEGVGLYGGFAGSETLLGQRKPSINITTLSGDIGTAGLSTDNSYHVIACAGVSALTIIDGFTITQGYADLDGGGLLSNGASVTLSNLVFYRNLAPVGRGGGMYQDSGSPKLTNVRFNYNYGKWGGGMWNAGAGTPALKNVSFTANEALVAGGGLYNLNSSPPLTNVTFDSNKAGDDGGGMQNTSSSPVLNRVTFRNNWSASDGGGMFNTVGSNAVLKRVSFIDNVSQGNGGGMMNHESHPVLDMVSFTGNVSMWRGGGMYNDTSSPMLTRVTLGGNRAYNLGGGMYNYQSSPAISASTISGNAAGYGGGALGNEGGSPALTNVTISGNTAIYGGAIYNYYSVMTLDYVTISRNTGFAAAGAYFNQAGELVIRNSILYGNGASEKQSDNTVTMTRSILKGGCGGDPFLTCTNVTTANPMLKPLASNGGFTKTMALPLGSPAIDTGACIPGINTDQRGIHRPQGGKCDKGAYEFVP